MNRELGRTLLFKNQAILLSATLGHPPISWNTTITIVEIYIFLYTPERQIAGSPKELQDGCRWVVGWLAHCGDQAGTLRPPSSSQRGESWRLSGCLLWAEFRELREPHLWRFWRVMGLEKTWTHDSVPHLLPCGPVHLVDILTLCSTPYLMGTLTSITISYTSTKT